MLVDLLPEPEYAVDAAQALYSMSDAAIDDVVGAAPATEEKVESWIKRRAAFEHLLGHDASSLFGLSGVLATLLPLVVAAAGQLIGM